MLGRKKVVVVGGGIAGIAAALEACTLPSAPEVVILEAASTAGGVISTFRSDGFVLERGPDSFFSDEETLGFLSRTGVASMLEGTSENGRRVFIMEEDGAIALPEGFFITAPRRIAPFLANPLFSFRGKVRALAEIFVPARRDGPEESAASFIRRRFGNEVFVRAAGPLIGGIYCASPEILGAESVLREFVEMEKKHGSVLRSLLFKREDTGGSGARYSRFLSPRGGMSKVIEAALRSLPEGCLRTGFRVSSLRRGDGGWSVVSDAGEYVRADAVVVAVPCGAAARMLEGDIADLLSSVEHSSCAVAALAYGTAEIPNVPDGFGVLFPRAPEGEVFSCSFQSRKFPSTAPPGFSILRFFMAGDDVCSLSDSEITARAHAAARREFGASALPVMSAVGNYGAQMPVCTVGHGDLLRGIENAAESLGAISFAGAAYGGVGIPDCIRSGRAAAKRLESSGAI